MSDDVEVDLPLLTLVVADAKPDEQELALDYWDHELDGLRPIWRHKVSSLVTPLGLHAGLVAEYILPFCQARAKQAECRTCGQSIQVASRAAFTALKGYEHCADCQAVAGDARARDRRSAVQGAAAARDVKARRTQYIAQSFEVSTGEDNDGRSWEDCPLDEVLLLRQMLTQTATGIIDSADAVDTPPIAPSGLWVRDIMQRLREKQTLLVHPSTSVDAFVWPDVGEVEAVDLHAVSYYPARLRWYMPGSGSLASRVERALAEIDSLLGGIWPERWVQRVDVLARELIQHEAFRFFEWAIGAHHLPEYANDEERTRLEGILATAAASLSLGQCYAVLWSISKDGGAVAQRHPYMPRSSATTHSINRLDQYLSKALSGGWDLRHFNERTEAPVTPVTKRFFTLLNASWMTTPGAACGHAARQHLPSPERARQQIIAGVNGEVCQKLVESISELSQAITLFVRQEEIRNPHVRLLARVLGNLPHVVHLALSCGLMPGDAVRSAYFGLEHVAALDSDSGKSSTVAATCQRFVEEALDERLDQAAILFEVSRPSWPIQFGFDDSSSVSL